LHKEIYMQQVGLTKLDELAINTIRTLAMDGVQKANSGHPGTPMGVATMAYTLWTEFMRYNPRDPQWPNRDRFVLSAGHASMLLYSLLYLTGYDLDLEDLKNFRQWGSKTPGHPEYGLTPGVETTTGPLGQGVGNAVGMALAEHYLAARYNKDKEDLFVVDWYVYGICSDGDLMEGVASEAASLAGELGLGRLILMYDDNHITIEGDTQLAFTEDVGKRFEAYKWHVQHIDGNDKDEVAAALEAARNMLGAPSLIVCRTEIAYGSPHKANTAEAHGNPLGVSEVKLTKENLGWPKPDETFYVPQEALDHFRQAVDRGAQQQAAWQARYDQWAAKYPDLAAEFQRMTRGELPPGWTDNLPGFKPEDGPMATRSAQGKVLNSIAAKLPLLVGGSADLAPSTDTYLKGFDDIGHHDFSGRNMHFGVREHGMGAVANGMTLSGLRAYTGTFLIFSDYMRPPMRLAALMSINPIFVFTHDSVGLGEDGPTHQPIEMLAALRAVPNSCVIRPADANETAAAWRAALERQDGPSLIVLTRQKVPIFAETARPYEEGLSRGAYVLRDAEGDNPDVILIGTGSEVQLAMGAADQLKQQGVRARVVSMPSWELFERQSQEYRDSVLPPNVKKRVSVEAAATFGWCRWVGDEGHAVGIDHYGASAPYEIIMEKFGLTAGNVAQWALAILGRPAHPAGQGQHPGGRHGRGDAPHEEDLEQQGGTETSTESPAHKQS
jgi:transketolase